MNFLLWTFLLFIKIIHCRKYPNVEASSIYSGSKISANNGEYPYIVSIYFNEWNTDLEMTETKQVCGAVIVRRGVLLTAGHCLNHGTDLPKENYTILAGTLKSNLENPDPSAQWSKVKASHVHDNYSYVVENGTLQELKNDIGIIFLDPPLNFTAYVKNISLAEEEDDPEALVGTNVRIMGWGSTANSSRSDNLMIADVIVKPWDNCTTLWEMSGNRTEIICLKDDLESIAGGSGDSGSPAIIDYDKALREQRVIGLHSGTLKDANTSQTATEYGSAYVNVAYMRPWIDTWLMKYDNDPDSIF